jgi:hypothetical protein
MTWLVVLLIVIGMLVGGCSVMAALGITTGYNAPREWSPNPFPTIAATTPTPAAPDALPTDPAPTDPLTAETPPAQTPPTTPAGTGTPQAGGLARVPGVVALDVVTARERLREAGFQYVTLKATTGEQVQQESEWRVFSQSPAADSQASTMTPVTLQVIKIDISFQAPGGTSGLR